MNGRRTRSNIDQHVSPPQSPRRGTGLQSILLQQATLIQNGAKRRREDSPEGHSEYSIVARQLYRTYLVIIQGQSAVARSSACRTSVRPSSRFLLHTLTSIEWYEAEHRRRPTNTAGSSSNASGSPTEDVDDESDKGRASKALIHTSTDDQS
jgi:hypothetical protein